MQVDYCLVDLPLLLGDRDAAKRALVEVVIWPALRLEI